MLSIWFPGRNEGMIAEYPTFKRPEVQRMPYGIIFMSEVLPTLILTAGGVAAFWIGTNTFLRLRRSGPPSELARISDSLELLHESMDDIREAMHSQLEDLRELSGRIEFTERLLTKARDENRI